MLFVFVYLGSRVVTDCDNLGNATKCELCPAGRYIDTINYAKNCRGCKSCKSNITLFFCLNQPLLHYVSSALKMWWLAFYSLFFFFFHITRARRLGLQMWKAPGHYLSLQGRLLQVQHRLGSIRLSQVSKLWSRSDWKTEMYVLKWTT